jgi:glycosyltransferase involved in cell wall biosynthesis
MTTTIAKDGVLHVCSDFPNQSIYTQLTAHLRAAGERQLVFSAVRSQEEVDRQPKDDAPMLRYSFQKVLHPLHRYFFRSKIRAARRALLRAFDPRECSLVHAHYLYSDAALALRLKREFGLPFATAVRNTDIYGFMRLRPDLWPIARRVLHEASAVIFLSPAYRDATFERIGPRMTAVVAPKTLVVPSGVPEVWLRNLRESAPEPADALRVLYVGDFTRNKNIPGTVRAVEAIRASRPARLTIVGGGGDGEEELLAMLREPRYAWVSRHEPIRDPERLRAIYRAHDVFAMPSFRETFGIVYLEALSQGVPVVHTRGQGVDGLLPDGVVSEGVDPDSPDSIAQAIVRSAERRPQVWQRCVQEATRFSWSEVARRYSAMYGRIRRGEPAAERAGG